MSEPIILFISGWAHAGKDSLAKILVESYEFQKLAFADPIKQQVAKNLEIPLEWCYDQDKKAESMVILQGRTLRDEIIRVAEEAREDDPEIWGRAIGEKIHKSVQRGGSRFVISDWRHLEELWAVQKILPKALLIPLRIERPSQIISPVPDRTEYSLLGFPFYKVFHNSGTIAKLLLQVVEFMEKDLPKTFK
jgi:hypothetical protein